ncbi:MAG: 3-oxoacyl-[acyl-carrier-protein] reductase [Candidatus Gastranaerophilales bacterium]|nr:3-oxoacyl-[acyl-carrier-protein] reductase [Candidatus Gastranaerophilales bacterium]
MEKKVALVTGASRGIGKACALELADAGYDVVINYVSSEAPALAVVEEIKAKGVNAKAVKFDVSDKDEVAQGIAAILEEFGRIDVLVNNAGITRDNLIIRMDDAAWEAVINTNLNSVFYVTKPVVKAMMKQRSGAIINMASICGVYGNAGQTNYSSAKAGVIGFTKALAKEVASRGITVNAVAPGFIATDMTHDLDKDKIAENIPLKRLGEVDDIAKTVRFLAEDGKYITSQVISVDGGLTI